VRVLKYKPLPTQSSVNHRIGPSPSNGSHQYQRCSDVWTIAPDRKRFSRRTPGRVSPPYCIGAILPETAIVQKAVWWNHKPPPVPVANVIHHVSCHSPLFRPPCPPCHPPHHLPYSATRQNLSHDDVITKSAKNLEKAQILLKSRESDGFSFIFYPLVCKDCAANFEEKSKQLCYLFVYILSLSEEIKKKTWEP